MLKNLALYFILLIFLVVITNATAQNSCTTNQSGNWNASSIWTCDSPPSPPPTGSWPDGYFININHAIEIPNNIIIDLSASGLQEIRLNADLTFGSNSKLVLPSGAKIIVASGVTIIASNNSQGTLIEIGGNGLWGRGCETDGCTNTDLTGPGTMDENSNPSNPLPVELLSFIATPEEKGLILQWSTASELNNDFFTLEKSRNGKDFEVIAQVEGNGTSHVKIDYSFTDRNPYLGLSYYRLSQTDYDGTKEIFPVISTIYTSNKNIEIYPNPVRDYISIKASGKSPNEEISLNIYNIQGNLLFKKRCMTDTFGNLYERILMDKAFEKGMYLIELKSSNTRDIIKVQKE